MTNVKETVFKWHCLYFQISTEQSPIIPLIFLIAKFSCAWVTVRKKAYMFQNCSQNNKLTGQCQYMGSIICHKKSANSVGFEWQIHRCSNLKNQKCLMETKLFSKKKYYFVNIFNLQFSNVNVLKKCQFENCLLSTKLFSKKKNWQF